MTIRLCLIRLKTKLNPLDSSTGKIVFVKSFFPNLSVRDNIFMDLPVFLLTNKSVFVFTISVEK